MKSGSSGVYRKYTGGEERSWAGQNSIIWTVNRLMSLPFSIGSVERPVLVLAQILDEIHPLNISRCLGVAYF